MSDMRGIFRKVYDNFILILSVYACVCVCVCARARKITRICVKKKIYICKNIKYKYILCYLYYR